MKERFAKVSLGGSRSHESDLDVLVRRLEMVEGAIGGRIDTLEAKVDLLRHDLGIATVDFEILGSERSPGVGTATTKLRRKDKRGG